MQRPQATRIEHNSLLYWATILYVVGVPNFIHFDTTGRTAEPVNLTSILTIVQTFCTGYLLIVISLLDRRPFGSRRNSYSPSLWIAMLLVFSLTSVLQPNSRSARSTDLFLSFFFLSQWLIAFLIIAALYSRTPSAQANALIVRSIGIVSWIWLGLVWIVLPFMPTQVYGASDESARAVRQLGGQLIHPGKLATLAGIGFFYALLFGSRGLVRWVVCVGALITMALTSARTAEIGFIFALLLYALFMSRKAIVRWGAIVFLLFTCVIGMTFNRTLERYVARGQSTKSLTSFDDRTRIWTTCWNLVKLRPILGYGYTVGARNAIRENWKYSHWIPPHAHNEFIEAAVDGGAVGLILVAWVYLCMSRKLFQNASSSRSHLFFLLVYLQLCVSAISGPILTYRYQTLGGIFVLCFIGTFGTAKNTSTESASRLAPLEGGSVGNKSDVRCVSSSARRVS